MEASMPSIALLFQSNEGRATVVCKVGHRDIQGRRKGYLGDFSITIRRHLEKPNRFQ